MTQSLYKHRIASGLCGSCGVEKIQPGESLGPLCKEKSRLRTAARRAKKNSQGLCVETGCHQKAVSGGRCAEHKEKQRLQRRDDRQHRKEVGLCVGCGCKKLPKEGCTLCQEHIDQLTANNRRRSQVNSKRS